MTTTTAKALTVNEFKKFIQNFKSVEHDFFEFDNVTINDNLIAQGCGIVQLHYKNKSWIAYGENYEYPIGNGDSKVSTSKWDENVENRIADNFNFDVIDDNGKTLSRKETRTIIENVLDLTVDYTKLNQQKLEVN